MKQYMLAVHGGEDSPYVSDEDMQEAFKAVEELNAEMQAKGVWVFGGGLNPPSTATVVKDQAGDITMTDGPYLEAKEHLGGFWVINAEDLDAALAWASKATVACKGAVEVRPFQDEPEG
ncbi:MAG: hypothetical protein QOG87_299 [Actinomycetota bacterium]|jgi:hypothetical protein